MAEENEDGDLDGDGTGDEKNVVTEEPGKHRRSKKKENETPTEQTRGKAPHLTAIRSEEKRTKPHTEHQTQKKTQRKQKRHARTQPMADLSATPDCPPSP